MKKILCLLLTVTMSFTSCKDYLTVNPSDAMFLQDVQALKQTLAAYLDNYSSNLKNGYTDAPGPWMNLLISSKYAAYADVWDFSKWPTSESAMQENEKRHIGRLFLGDGSSEWARFYAIGSVMNLVLNEIDTAEGDEDMRNYVKGEALIHRSFGLFKLLQFYAPMNDASLGIPLYFDTYGGFADADLSRKSQKEAYDRIIADLLEAERLLGITAPRETYNKMYNYDHVYRILAMVYQWKASSAAAEDGDWAKAAEAAENAIAAAGNALPWTVAELKTNLFRPASQTSQITYPEALVGFLSSDASYTYIDFGFDADIWRSLYAENDDRKYEWFMSSPKNENEVTSADLNPVTKVFGYSFWGILNYRAVVYFRLAETYMIRIEAYAHTDFAKAKDLFAQWQSLRYTGGTLFVPASAEALLEEIRIERKREFVYETDLPWLDMKRYGATDSGRKVFSYDPKPLEQYDFRYNFMIPDSETATNPGIKRNPEWESYRNL